MDVTQRQVDDMLDAARAPRCVVDAVSRHARPGRTDAPQAIEEYDLYFVDQVEKTGA